MTGSSPPGVVPTRMLAAVIRPERYGPPEQAYRLEEVAVPPLGPRQVLVKVVAAGVNFNGVWAALAHPVDVIARRRRHGDPDDFHIGGSEGSGVVWAVGDQVTSLEVGREVVLTGTQWDVAGDPGRPGADPSLSRSRQVWGYETNYGSFAEYTVVEEYQCHPKPSGLSWEEAGCFLVSGATAWRQLCGWPPHTVQPGDPVLIWGGGGGLGTMAIQIARAHGGLPVAVVSSDERADFCRRLGAVGVLDRRRFDHWGRPPDPEDEDGMAAWLHGARAFRQAFWEALGEDRDPRIVLEHPGRDTMPTSLYVCGIEGMVVTCGATTGFALDVDARFLWMRQKRLQGSHFASAAECAAVIARFEAGALDACLSRTHPFSQIGHAHQLMHDNAHPPGQMAVRIDGG